MCTNTPAMNTRPYFNRRGFKATVLSASSASLYFSRPLKVPTLHSAPVKMPEVIILRQNSSLSLVKAKPGLQVHRKLGYQQ